LHDWTRIEEVVVNIAIFLGAVTISLFFTLGIVEAWYGPHGSEVPRVTDRFLEKPSQHDTTFIRDWIEKYPRAARHYAFPVLFPLDLLFMIFLGGFLSVGSVLAADTIDWLKQFASLFVIVPAAYVLADLIEDTLPVRLLLDAHAISDASVKIAQVVTKVKLVAAGFAIVQTIVVSGLAVTMR
jgi:hypothetical protein